MARSNSKTELNIGTLVEFNAQAGTGWIIIESTSTRAFFHVLDLVERSSQVSVGTKLRFELSKGYDSMRARRVEVVT